MFTLRSPPHRKAAAAAPTLGSSWWDPRVPAPDGLRWERGWRGPRRGMVKGPGGSILPQLRAEKLHSALFNCLPQPQARLINFGLPLISHLEESRRRLHSEPAPVLSVKILCRGAFSWPDLLPPPRRRRRRKLQARGLHSLGHPAKGWSLWVPGLGNFS